MLRFWKAKKIAPLYLTPGDTLTLSYNDEPVLSHPVEKDTEVDTVGVFEFENEYGLKEGIGGVFGKSYEELSDE